MLWLEMLVNHSWVELLKIKIFIFIFLGILSEIDHS